MKNNLVISFNPAGDINVASSRLRCFYLYHELKKIHESTFIGIKKDFIPDILFVQKKITKELYDYAVDVKSNYGIVVYDIDDYGDRALAWVKSETGLFTEFIKLCDILTVDTVNRANIYRKSEQYKNIPEIIVVPDPIDYFYVENNLNVQRINEGFWFGNAPNITPSIPSINFITDSLNNKISVMTNKKYIDAVKQILPNINVLEWSYNGCANQLRSLEYTVLFHANDLEGSQKSNNKMLACLSNGNIPFLSDTPAYKDTANIMGLEDLIVYDLSDYKNKLNKNFFESIRIKMKKNVCKDYMEKLSPPYIANEFYTLMLAKYPF